MNNSEKGIITISINKDVTKEEIKEIRRIFKEDKQYEDYKLNIIVSGSGKFKENLKDFIKSGLKV
jgi:hypothetical protein